MIQYISPLTIIENRIDILWDIQGYTNQTHDGIWVRLKMMYTTKIEGLNWENDDKPMDFWGTIF